MFTVQCKVCTNFYFNWNTDFLQHWVENHSNNQEKKDDENDLLLLNYWCSTCDVRTLSLSDMTEHLRSENHFDLDCCLLLLLSISNNCSFEKLIECLLKCNSDKV